MKFEHEWGKVPLATQPMYCSTCGEPTCESANFCGRCAETTMITVERDALVLERAFGGSGGRRPVPPRKVYKLSPADKERLLKLIKSNNLLVTDSIELTQAASNYRYFELSVVLTLGEKKGVINVGGLRTGVKIKEAQLYQRTLALVEKLY